MSWPGTGIVRLLRCVFDSVKIRPSLDVLTRLAELYQCAVADLLADCGDFRSRDNAYRAGQYGGLIPAVFSEPGRAGGEGAESANGTSGSDLDQLVQFVEQADVHNLARMAASWSNEIMPDEHAGPFFSS